MYDTISNRLYQEAYGFVAERADRHYLKEQLSFPQHPAANTMIEVYRRLIDALLRNNKMKKAIGQVEPLSEHLFEFDPMMTHAEYSDQWERMLESIRPRIGQHDEAYWEVFCIGALSGASFLSQLGFLEDFNDFVKGFYHNEMSMAVLPLLLQKEIAGLDYASACAFLNKTGYPDYVPVNQKVKALLHDTGIIESRNNYEALKALIVIAQCSERSTAHVHGLFCLIGHGRLSEKGAKDNKVCKAFIKHVTPVLDSLSPNNLKH